MITLSQFANAVDTWTKPWNFNSHVSSLGELLHSDISSSWQEQLT